MKAVKSLSFSVNKGTVFGILGPNGSGKTTTLGIILGILQAQSGSWTWFGEAPSASSLKRIGAILETPNFYPHLSGQKNLEIVAAIKGVSQARIGEVLEQVNLGKRGGDRFSSYSLGMKQRLALAGALLNEPEVLVLDEPTNGLDPQGIAEVREVISEVAAQGTTILLASHLLDEVEKVCSEVAILNAGELLYCGPVAGVVAGANKPFAELRAPDMQKLRTALEAHPDFEKLVEREKGLLAYFNAGISGAELNSYLFQQGVVVEHLALRKQSLEKQFLELISQTQ